MFISRNVTIHLFRTIIQRRIMSTSDGGGTTEERNVTESTTAITELPDFIERMERLLKLERDAECEQNRLLIESRSLDELCHAGKAVKKVRLLNRRTGLGGRKLLKFGYSDTNDERNVALPNHKLSPGDIVNLCPSNDYRNPLASGVVSKVVEHSITVAFDYNDRSGENGEQLSLFSLEFSNKTFVIVQSVNDVTFRRLSTTLAALKDYKKYQGWILAEYFFGTRQLPPIDNSTIAQDQHSGQVNDETDGASKPKLNIFNQNLNSPQRGAVDFCLNEHHPICVVHGPPGTGKTTVVVEIIRQLIRKQKKVLACAPSNVAVDNLLEKLVNSCSNEDKDSFEFVRLGHPARTHSNVQKYTLDIIMKRKEYSDVLDDIRSEMESLEKEKNRRYANAQRKRLRHELVEREKTALGRILRNANVICGTLTSISRDGPLGHLLKKDDDVSVFTAFGRNFDVAVIDECGQATELSCWSALLAVTGEKCILAGDHLQLPPTVISEEAAKEGYDRSLMARAADELGENIVNLLTVQYRMNYTIMKWPSDHVYHGKLEADESVRNRLLRDMPNVQSTEETESALWLIDTSDCDMTEIVTVDDESKANVGEVRLLFLHVDRLIKSGVAQSSIAVISPYNLQVQLLRMYLGGVYPNVSIRSIDGFQGQERDAVVLSLVRSNNRGEVGFLSEQRRMNVAVTRAKRHLAVIADARTVSADPFLRSLMDYFNENGIVKSALEYEDDCHFIPFSIDLDGLALNSTNSNSTTTTPNTTKSSKPASNDQKQERKKEKKNTVKKQLGAKKSIDVKKELEENRSEADWRRELKEQLDKFVLDENATRFEFPTTLAAFQRAYIHEMAEHFNLEHYSKNEGDARRIIVEKMSKRTDEVGEFDTGLDDSAELAQPEATEAKSENIINECKHIEIESVKHKTGAVSRKKRKNVKAQSSASAAAAVPAKETPPMDDEALMDEFAKAGRLCKFSGCKQPISVLGEKCRYCIQVFCLKHGLPEVHGCGEAAKRHARMEWERTMGGSMKVSQRETINVEKREKLRAKLDTKLKDMKGQRQQKKEK